jgi:hypothetical protein
VSDTHPSTAEANRPRHVGPERPEPPMSPIGQGWVPLSAILVLLGTVLLIACLLLYGIWAVWPSASGGRLEQQQDIALLGAHISTDMDVTLFVLVAASGALGGLIHTVRSLSWYLGNRSLRWSWVPFCMMLPIVGASAATVFYLVFRAGLFSPSSTSTEANPFGFAAIAALVGLFSEQAMEKLREVFGTVLAAARTGADHVEAREDAVQELPPSSGREHREGSPTAG